jgi:hypothetical protein
MDSAEVAWDRSRTNYSDSLWNELVRGDDPVIHCLGQRHLQILHMPRRGGHLPHLERRPITRWGEGENASCGCCSARFAIWVADHNAATGVLLQIAVFADLMDMSSKAQDSGEPLGSLFLPIEGQAVPVYVSIDEISGRVCVLMGGIVNNDFQRLVVIDLY